MPEKTRLTNREKSYRELDKGRKEEKIWFINQGGPYRHLDGSIKLPNKKFKAYPSEITEGLRVHIKPLDGSASPEKTPLPTPVIASGYEIKSKGGAYYNVVQKETGKIMNEKGLRQDKAEELLKSLEE